MAVTWLRETGDGRESSTDDKGVKSATRTFLAVTNSMLDGARTVETSWGVPRIGVPYFEPNGAIDASMRCKKVQASATDLWWKWKITCNYDSAPRDSKDKEKQEPNPVLRPPRFSFGCKKQRVALEKDAMGRPIVNAAEDPFDPPIEQERPLLTMTVEKNFAIFNPLVINTYVQSVNADLFLGWPAKTVLVDDIDAQEKEENDYTFWGVKYVFLFAIHGTTWELEVLNQGTNEIYLVNGVRNKRAITDAKTKQAITKPVLLTVDGFFQDPLDGLVEANFVKFDVYPVVQFGGLGLG